MKNTRQANIWKNKVKWFNDGTVENINVVTRSEDGTAYENIIAIVNNGLALHLELAPTYHSEYFYNELFSITHVESGMVLYSGMTKDHNYDEKNIYKCDYDALLEKAINAWDQMSKQTKKELQLVEGINRHVA